MALTPEQADLVDLVRAAEAMTDRVTTGFWERVLDISEDWRSSWKLDLCSTS